MSQVQIQTSQNIAIQYQIASVSDRIFAIVIDWLLQLIAFTAVIIVTFSSIDRFIIGQGAGTIFTLIMLPLFLYPLLTEFFLNGQTIGKRIMKIKVVMLDGSQATLGAYLLRWLIGFIELYIFSGGLALLALLISPRGQRLGDMAAGTTVIKIQKPVSLDDTIFKAVEEDYTPVFLAASKLNDQDVAIIREVIETVGQLDNAAELQQKVRRAVLTKMEVETDMPTGKLLETIIKDYNALNGRV